MKPRIREGTRVLFAIAAKDIVDAIKNRSILSQIFTVAFIVVAYRFLPVFSNGDALPRLVLYDAGRSKLVEEMEESTTFDLVDTASQTAMEAYVEDRDTVVLGLVLPSDLDVQVATGSDIELEGYVVHWASHSQVTEVKTFFEKELSELADDSIHIRIDGNIVYTRPDSRGLAFLVSLSAVLVMVIAGAFIVPLLMLEEKQSKTLDALLVSPASPSLVVLGKALSGSLYCSIAGGAVLALNYTLVTQWGFALLAILLGVFFAVSLGLLLGSIFEMKQQLTLWGFVAINILCIPLFLSPMDDLLPAGVMAIMRGVPSVALMKVLRVSFSKGAAWNDFGSELAIVLGGTALLLAAEIWVVRRSDRQGSQR
jgi:ABC-2 type transport system permease protein